MKTLEYYLMHDYEHVVQMTSKETLDTETLRQIFTDSALMSQINTSPKPDIISLTTGASLCRVTFSNVVAQSNMMNNLETLLNQRLSKGARNAMCVSFEKETISYPKPHVA